MKEGGGGEVVDAAALDAAADHAALADVSPGAAGAVPVAADPVSVAGRSGLARGMREQIAETVLNGGVPASGASGAAGGPAIPLSLRLLGGGPKRVEVSGPAGQLALLSRGDVVAILATGDPGTLGPALLSALAANGVNPMVFAQRVHDLLP
jgi:hypothetical protein